MPEFLVPGPVVEDASRPAPIAGVTTSNGAVIGVARRGPVNTPTLIESIEAFREIFGEPGATRCGALAHAADGFFRNGGRRLAAIRVEPDPAASLASVTIGVDDDDPARRTGIYAFRNVEGPLMIAMPGLSDATAQAALLEMCEREKDKFAILDSAETATPDDVIAQRSHFDSRYGALYYPWIVDDRDNRCAPSGYVMGVYARSDVERGVHHAPVNAVVEGAVRLAYDLDRNTAQTLGAFGVNELRRFGTSSGDVRIWGARTLSSSGSHESKYVPICRYLHYLEQSLGAGTQWAVFEPNEDPLWARVRTAISDFLIDSWRGGALVGTRPSDAFFVRCDRSTMTQSDIDGGRLIVEIGVAPLRPAEFVIFRIGQWTACDR